MRNWFRPSSARPQQRPLRSKFVYHRPALEELEARIVPAQQYLSLGNLLTFYGDFSGPTGSNGQTIYTGSSATSTNQAVQIGPYTANPANFQPMLWVENGTVSFDTNSGTNPDFNLTLTGAIVNELQNSIVPQGSTVATVSGLTGQANDLLSGGFQLASPYNYPPLPNGIQPGDTIPGDFFLTIYSIGMANDPIYNVPALALTTQLAINIPGGNPPIYMPPDGTPPADQIALGSNSGDLLYFNNASPFGFDFSGLSLGITDQFTFNGLTIQPTGLSLDIQPQQGTQPATIEIFGDITVSTQSAQGSDKNFALSATANFGTASAPGLQFNTTTHQITQFNLGVSGQFTLGGLTVTANQLNIAYNSSLSSNQLALSGSVSLALEGYTFTVGLQGPNGGPGLTIDSNTGQAQFNGLQLGISNFDLGAFSINNAYLNFTESSGTLDLAGGLALSFPGGWGASGSFQFQYSSTSGFELQEIGVSITAGGEGVPVGDTDLFVTYISGELDGLGTPNWSVSGTIGVAFGQSITVDGKTWRIVDAVGGFTLNKDELILNGTVAFAGYSPANNPTQLHSYIGILSGNVTLDWGDGIYSANVNGSFFDSLFTVTASFKYSQGDFVLSASANLNVPANIPLIGGDSIAGIDFLFVYHENNGNPTGLLAAWVDLPIIGDAGIEVPLGGSPFFGSPELIGKGGVQAAEAQASMAMGPTYNSYTQSFTVPTGATSFNFAVQFVPVHDSGQSYHLALTTPDHQVIVDQSGNGTGKITGSDGSVMFADDTGLTSPAGQILAGLQASNGTTPLPNSGNYMLTLYSTDDLDPNALVWSGLAGYLSPATTGPLTFTQSGTVLTFTQPLTLDAGFVANATADLYLDTTPQGNHGVIVATTTQFTGSGDSYTATFSNVDLATLVQTLSPAPVPLYFYAVVNDGFDTPLTTGYSPAAVMPPPVSGTLTETGDGRARTLGGFTVYIDQNGNGQFDLGEATDITNRFGTYWFYDNPNLATPLNFQAGQTYAVGLVLPPTGFNLPPPVSPTTSFTYNGVSTSRVDLQVWQQDTIAGTVFDDLNGNGVQDPGEPGVSGVTVSTTPSNTDPSLSTTTASDGSFEIIGVPANESGTLQYMLPAGSQTSGPTTHAYATVDAYGRVTTDASTGAALTFGLLPAATIGGNVSGYTTGGGSGTQPQGQAGWTVQLNGPSGPTTTTDPNGNYLFTGLAPGNYTVQVQTPSGWQQLAPFTTNPSFGNNNIITASAFQAANGEVAAVVTGDFNNDGILDYAAAYQEGGFLDYYYGINNGTGQGTGQFTFNQIINVLPVPIIDVQTGDFNGDGYTDLLALGNNGQVAIALGSASGFTSSKIVYTPASGATVYGVAVDNMPGTWDGDNKDDFVVYGQQIVNFGGESSYYYFVDICSSSKGFQPVRLDAGTPTHYLSPGSLPALSDHALAIGDINGDGNLDLFINFQTLVLETDVAFIAYGHGDGTFGQPGPEGTGISFGFSALPDLFVQVPFNGGPVALADINGDGLLDAVTLSTAGASQTQKVNVIEQTSVGTWYDLNGNFSSPNNDILPFDASNTGRTFVVPQIAIADVNGDGLPDILLVENPNGNGAGQLLTYLNQGSTMGGISIFNNNANVTPVPAFIPTTLNNGTTTNSQPNSLALGDYNNDGQIDAILGDAVSNPTNQQYAGGIWLLTNTSQIVGNPTIAAQSNGQYAADFIYQQLSGGSGAVVNDANRNGQRDGPEKGLAGITVFIDLNNNGTLDPGEPYTTTNAAGLYSFASLPVGQTGPIRVLADALVEQDAGPQGYPVPTAQSAKVPLDFAIHQHLLQGVGDVVLQPGQPLAVPVPLTKTARLAQRNAANRLVYTLEAGAPAGMTIDPRSGLVSWVPPANQTPGTYKVTVRVRDPQQPLQTDTRSFTVTLLGQAQHVQGLPPFLHLVPVGAKAGRPPRVRVYNADGSLRFTLWPYGRRFRGGVRVAAGDINGDGIDDIVTATGPGGMPIIKVFDGRTGRELRSFRAYRRSYRKGVFVAVGGLDGNGQVVLSPSTVPGVFVANGSDGGIITSAEVGGRPLVKVFSAQTGAEMQSFVG
jgi:hypothetical protein